MLLASQLAHTAAAIRDEAFVSRRRCERAAVPCRRADRRALRQSGLTLEPAAWREMFHTFAEFEESPPLSFAIGGFLQNDGCTMIGGLSGRGRTLILFDCSRTSQPQGRKVVGSVSR
jgi:hypothetical protein